MNASLSRFALLFRKQWVEHRRLYLMSLLVLFLLQLFLLLLTAFTSGEGLGGGIVSVISILGVLLAGSLFTSTQLNSFRNRSEAISSFMLPASAGEKIAVAVTYALILFPLVFFALFMLNYYTVYLVERNYGLGFSDFNVARYPMVVRFTLLYWLSQAFVLLCSLLFRRFSFIISVSVMIVVAIAASSVNDTVLEAFRDGRMPAKKLVVFNDQPQQVLSVGLSSSSPLMSAGYTADVMRERQQLAAVYFEIGLPNTSFWLFQSFLLLTIILLLYIVRLKLKEQQL